MPITFSLVKMAPKLFVPLAPGTRNPPLALDMVEIMKQHHSVFGISMKRDLVASTQDGAFVNKKYIRNLDDIGQFCLNHGIHIWSMTPYKKKHHLKI